MKLHSHIYHNIKTLASQYESKTPCRGPCGILSGANVWTLRLESDNKAKGVSHVWSWQILSCCKNVFMFKTMITEKEATWQFWTQCQLGGHIIMIFMDSDMHIYSILNANVFFEWIIELQTILRVWYYLNCHMYCSRLQVRPVFLHFYIHVYISIIKVRSPTT